MRPTRSRDVEMKKVLIYVFCALALLAIGLLVGSRLGGKTGSVSRKIHVQEKQNPPVVLNKDNFPDPNFRDTLCRMLSFTEGDTIPFKVLSSVEELRLRDLGIRNLKGVELFSSLTQLDCSGNLLQEIDVSKNLALKRLECARNQLSHLDVTHNVKLEGLGCSKNNLRSINVSNNPNLQSLLCNGNLIGTIDVSKNPKLQELGVNDCDLNVLNVSNNTLLENLYCSGNKFAELDLRSNTKMKNLYCKQPFLKHIKVLCPANNPELGKGTVYWGDELTLIWFN